jgi:hypothetical protein
MQNRQPHLPEFDKLYLLPEKVHCSGVEQELGGVYRHLWRNFDVARFARDWKGGIGRVPTA